MGIGLKNRLAVGATPVPDVFIDTYMAGASGDLVRSKIVEKSGNKIKTVEK